MSLKLQKSDRVPFWTPRQPKVGKFLRYFDGVDRDPPTLFQPLDIRGMTISNRIGTSPMCTYSSEHFEANKYHLVHYGSISSSGPGLVIVESSAIDPLGASSPNDLGIYTETQAATHKENIVDWAHVHNIKIGVQLGHAGRKASLAAPLNGQLGVYVPKEEGGWPDDIMAPSAVPFDDSGVTPKELTIDQTRKIIKQYGISAKLAVEKAGYDFVEIHAGYGYLPCQFYTKTANKRKDRYGGSFENRTRFLLETIDEVRSSISNEVPIFVRLCADENVEDPEGWKMSDTLRLLPSLVEHGVDVIDVCSGGLNYKEYGWDHPNFLPPKEIAKQIKEHSDGKILVASTGGSQDGAIANSFLNSGSMDILLIGRIYLKNSGIVWQFADDLGIHLEQAKQKAWIFDAEGYLKK
ncbi:unnamed protein product [Kluyveromyces dobzhanskii CBS 2104]|uniref:WGS project CCBQ000000000 data, contig MAT n=1 Tax=Kluyveromyces dobzhanskii CBS 2104 TaxID=1427455 RepID=A0A0A8L1M0_9SACH|nr:unnamed protein product [Kluyveromyces dobzhanskii CBS 2104]